MHWIIGLDLQHDHAAPAAFARWLPEPHTFVAAHFVDRALIRGADADVVEQVLEGAATALQDSITGARLPPARTEVALAHGTSAEKALADIALERNADGIVVARRAAAGDDRVLRLGRVARRLVRRLPTPVVVVPPELTTEGIRPGPVLLAIDGEHDARHAARFAAALAHDSGRELEMVHVFRKPFTAGVTRAPASYRAGMYERYRVQQRERLQRWLDVYGLAGPKIHEVEGDPVTRIAHVAADQGACLVVCASRQLTVTERIFGSSVGSHLAASAPFPVAIVGSV